MNNIIWLTVQLAVAVAFFVLGKFVFPAIPKDKLDILAKWATRFVIWARDFMDAEGEQKFEVVINELEKICAEYGVHATRSQLEAIVQAAYDAMIRGMADNDPA